METFDGNQTLTLENRKKLIIDGVMNIISFNDDYMDLSTNFGDITIEGTDLKIEELLQESGKILICGDISGIFYKQTKNSKKRFGNIFK